MSYVIKRDRARPFVAAITDPKSGEVDHTRSFATRKAAKAYIVEQEGRQRTGTFVSPKDGKVTFGERWEYHRFTMVDLRPSSRARDESYARSQVLPHFENVELCDIDHDMVQSWVTALMKTGYAASTIHKAHGVLSKTLKGCVAQRLIFTNPCEHTKLPPITISEQMFLTYEQVEDLVSEIHPHFALAVRLASYTGVRAGELFGLRVRDLKIDGNYINLRRKLTEVSGHLYFDDYLKSHAGYRQISVPGALMDELAVHTDGADGDDLVFTAMRGGAVRLSIWRRRVWYPATVECGFATIDACTAGVNGACEICGKDDPAKLAREGHYDGLRLHDLRHSAVSFWIDQGRNMFEITKMIGQKDSRLIDSRYGHLLPKEHDAANDKLNARMLEAKARKAGENVTPFTRRRGVA